MRLGINYDLPGDDVWRAALSREVDLVVEPDLKRAAPPLSPTAGGTPPR